MLTVTDLKKNVWSACLTTKICKNSSKERFSYYFTKIKTSQGHHFNKWFQNKGLLNTLVCLKMQTPVENPNFIFYLWWFLRLSLALRAYKHDEQQNIPLCYWELEWSWLWSWLCIFVKIQTPVENPIT